MSNDIIINTCKYLAKAIDNNDELGIRVYCSALLGGIFSDFNDYEQVLVKLATASEDDLIEQAQCIYSMTAMKYLLVEIGNR